MYIYLIRHGVTEWNKISRIQGREDIPLSVEGEAQAAECARVFQSVPVSIVASSPLSRAVRTAELIFSVPVTVDPLFTERDYGSASGRILADIFRPEEYADDLEPLDEVADRMLAGIAYYASRSPGDVAVISHGGSINAVLRRLSGGTIGSGVTRLKNACICVLSLDNGSLSVAAYNMDAAEFDDWRSKI